MKQLDDEISKSKGDAARIVDSLCKRPQHRFGFHALMGYPWFVDDEGQIVPEQWSIVQFLWQEEPVWELEELDQLNKAVLLEMYIRRLEVALNGSLGIQSLLEVSEEELRHKVEEEDDSFWYFVSQHLSGRCPDECKRIWCYQSHPLPKIETPSKIFTKMEDEVLLSLYKLIGDRYGEISEHLDCLPWQARNRLSQLLEKPVLSVEEEITLILTQKIYKSKSRG